MNGLLIFRPFNLDLLNSVFNCEIGSQILSRIRYNSSQPAQTHFAAIRVSNLFNKKSGLLGHVRANKKDVLVAFATKKKIVAFAKKNRLFGHVRKKSPSNEKLCFPGTDLETEVTNYYFFL